MVIFKVALTTAASCIEDMSFSTQVKLNVISEGTGPYGKHKLGVERDFLRILTQGEPTWLTIGKASGQAR